MANEQPELDTPAQNRQDYSVQPVGFSLDTAVQPTETGNTDAQTMDQLPNQQRPSAPTKVSRTVTSIAGLDAIKETLKNNGIWISNLIQDVTRGGEKEQAELANVATHTIAVGESAADAARTEAVIKGASSATRERILKILNLDTRAADNRVATELATFESIKGDRERLAADIDQRMGVGFFDNPLQFLINETILPGEVAQHNALVRRSNQAMNTIENLQGIAKKQEDIDVAATADQIAMYGDAMAKMHLAQANAQAAEARSKIGGAIARTASVVIGAIDKEFDNRVKVASLERVLYNEKEEDQKKAKDKEEDAALDAKIKRLAAVVGVDMDLATLKRESKAKQTVWLDRVSKSTPGDDLFEALTFINDNGNVKRIRASGSADFAKLATDLTTQVKMQADVDSQKYMGEGVKAPPRAELLKNAADKLTAEINAAKINMFVAKGTNPYKIDHKTMGTMWAGDPKNPVAEFVRTATKQNVGLTDQQVFTTVDALVSGGKLSAKDAAFATTEYFNEAVKSNNRRRSFPLLGLDEQENYVILPSGSKLRIDLTNPISVENYFTNKIAQQKAEQQMFNVQMGTVGAPK